MCHAKLLAEATFTQVQKKCNKDTGRSLTFDLTRLIFITGVAGAECNFGFDRGHREKAFAVKYCLIPSARRRRLWNMHSERFDVHI